MLAGLRVGNDICSIPRIQALLVKRGPRFVEKILTTQEQLQPRAQAVLSCVALGASDQKPHVVRRAASFLAGRFAAKEAVFKVLGPHRPRLGFRDIEIRTPQFRNAAAAAVVGQAGDTGGDAPHDDGAATVRSGVHDDHDIEPHDHDRMSSGPPFAVIVADESAGRAAEEELPISISHDGDYATAVCIAVETRRPHDPEARSASSA